MAEKFLTQQDKLAAVYSKDDYDYSQQSKFNHPVKECVLCKKMFYPEGRNWSRQRYCKRTHVVDCLVCGKSIEQKDLSTIKFTCSKQCCDKFRQSQTESRIVEKYGYTNVSQVPEFKAKISRGIKAASDQITKSRTQTMQEKYGGSGTASPIIRKKIEATMLQRYGVTNPSFSKDICTKISDIAKSPEHIAKYEATAMANWGTKRPSQTKEVQDKMKQTVVERYGVECALQTDYAKDRLKQVCLEKYGVENALMSDEAKAKARESLISNRHDHCSRISKLNQSIAEILFSEFGIETEFEWFVKDRKCYDFKVKDRNIVIEIDPSYTHSEILSHWGTAVEPDYHLKRTQLAEECGYRCIHVFDWDDIAKLATLLQDTKPVYARKCVLKQIDPKDAKVFLNDNHIQGNASGAKYAVALFSGSEMICAMTFCKPRYNKNYQWELLRLCTLNGYHVVGGASRLFKQFVKDCNPESVISYCDKAKFSGQVYSQLGFKLHHSSPPAKIWSKGSEHVTDNLLRQRGFDQLFNASYGKGTSNEQLMLEHGWLPVYDCGQSVFVWER